MFNLSHADEVTEWLFVESWEEHRPSWCRQRGKCGMWRGGLSMNQSKGTSADYIFKPHERPMLVGSPANPDHPAPRRVGYFAIGSLIGITGGLGNALVTVNLNFAQGTLGLYSNESAWLSAAYFMTNANLLLVKYRQQFGLQPFIRTALVV